MADLLSTSMTSAELRQQRARAGQQPFRVHVYRNGDATDAGVSVLIDRRLHVDWASLLDLLTAKCRTTLPVTRLYTIDGVRINDFTKQPFADLEFLIMMRCYENLPREIDSRKTKSDKLPSSNLVPRQQYVVSDRVHDFINITYGGPKAKQPWNNSRVRFNVAEDADWRNIRSYHDFATKSSAGGGGKGGRTRHHHSTPRRAVTHQQIATDNRR